MLSEDLSRTVQVPVDWGTGYFAARFFMLRGVEGVGIGDYELGTALHVYDGINNAGIGSCDVDSMIWKDLVPQDELDFTIVGSGF